MTSLHDGNFVVLFNQSDISGRLTGQMRVGGFVVRNGAITSTDGICRGMLPIGPITPVTELRITYGLNNAYYEVQSTLEFQPKAMKKSTGQKIKIRGHAGLHDVASVKPGPDTLYILTDGTPVPSSMTESPTRPIDSDHEKLHRAIDPHVQSHLAGLSINRDYVVPGLSGYDHGGKVVYIDARLPRKCGDIDVDHFLAVHEVVEKTLIDRLGFCYRHAHNIALRAERRAVELAGHSWDQYDHFMQEWIRKIGEEVVPKDQWPPNFEPSSQEDVGRNPEDSLAKSGSERRVACVAVWDGRRMLMGKRNDDDRWTNPGGHLNPGEDPVEGAKRELFEETGIMAKTLEYLGVEHETGNDGQPLTVYAFKLEGHPDEITTEQDPDEEVQDWRWIDFADGVPEDVANSLHVPLGRNVLLRQMGLTRVTTTNPLKKTEDRPLQFAFGTEKLREMRDHIDRNGGVMKGKEFEKRYNLGSMGLGHLKDGQGNVSSERIQQHIDQLPKVMFTVSHDKFGDDPRKSPAHPNHPLHNYYKNLYGAHLEEGQELPDPLASQKHSSEPSKVLQINMTPEHIRKLKEAGVWSTYQRMNSASVQSGHPVKEGNGIGWIRYTERPDGIFIDELQSDLAQSYARTFDHQAEMAQQLGMMTPEDADRQRARMMEAFPEEHHEKIKEILFGDKHPAQVMHEAAHNYFRQNGYVGKPIHMWTVEGKKEAALSDQDAAAPGHMQFAYGQNPRRMGYESGQYGELETQHGEHQGKPTWKTTLRKSVILLGVADRLTKSDDSGGGDVFVPHPWMKGPDGKPEMAKQPSPGVAAKHEAFVDSNLSRTLGRIPKTHHALFKRMSFYLRNHPTRHVRKMYESPKENPTGPQVPTMRLRHLKSFMYGDPHIQMQFGPGTITVTDHEPHGQFRMPGKPQWRFSHEKGMEFVGYVK